MNIKYLIIGIVSFVLGIIILMWFIKKPIKFHEDPKDNMGADDIVQHENLNKSWNPSCGICNPAQYYYKDL